MPGPAQKTLIPNSATASVSIRIVPDQSLDEIVKMLKAHLERSFATLKTTNKLSVRSNLAGSARKPLTLAALADRHQPRRRLGALPSLVLVPTRSSLLHSPQWLGDLSSPYVAAMSSCISSQWGIDPLFIREGGSIPSLPFLEREFGADAVHFPMGTSSDSAHLPDERIRVLNLEVRSWASCSSRRLSQALDRALTMSLRTRNADRQVDRLEVVHPARLPPRLAAPLVCPRATSIPVHA